MRPWGISDEKNDQCAHEDNLELARVPNIIPHQRRILMRNTAELSAFLLLDSQSSEPMQYFVGTCLGKNLTNNMPLQDMFFDAGHANACNSRNRIFDDTITSPKENLVGVFSSDSHDEIAIVDQRESVSSSGTACENLKGSEIHWSAVEG